MSLLRKLLKSHRRTTRRPSRPARPALKPRLGIHQLDDRILPSAATSFANGVLNITDDNNGSWVFLSGSASALQVSHDSTSQTFTNVSKVVFRGGAGNDGLSNTSSMGVQAYGSAGSDSYEAYGSTTNFLDRNGFNTNWTFTGGGARAVVYGLGSATPSAADLSAPGAMMVSLSPDSTQLTVAGPTGIGFRLDVSGGTWQDSLVGGNNGQTSNFFSLSSPGATVKLHAGSILGDIPLLGAGVTNMFIYTKFEPWADPVGEFNAMSFGSGGGLPLNTQSATLLNGAANSLVALGNQYGVDVNLPALGWGLKLGSDLKTVNGFGTAPLNSAVPYFYYANSPNFSGQVGGLSFQAGNPGVQVAFDPSDPFLYAAVPINNVAVGVSANGRIPYAPQVPFTGQVFGASVPDPCISGNVYLAGTIPLADTPLSITGSVVIGLVKDAGGQPSSGLDRTTADAVLQGQRSLISLANAMSAKPQIGVNGELDVGVDVGGGAINLGMKVGEASAFFVPNYVNPNPTPTNDYKRYINSFVPGFYTIPTWASGPVFSVVARSTDPFAAVPVVGSMLSTILSPGSFNLSGMIDSQRNWAVHVDGQTSGFFGFQPDALLVDGSSLLNTLNFWAQIHPGLGLSHTTTGTLNIAIHSFQMTDSAGFSFGIQNLATVSGSKTLTLGYANGTAYGSLDVNASASLGVGSANFSAHVGVGVGTDHAFGNAGFSLTVLGVNVANLNGHIDQNGGSINYLGTNSSWSWGPEGALNSDGPARVGQPAQVRFFVPAGVDDPLHFSAALSPDGLAPNYAAAGADPNPAFTFSAPGTYTVYGRMYESDGKTSDYSTTVTVYALSQADTLFVDKLYHDLLGRAAAPAELDAYTSSLATGASRAQVAAGFLNSAEYRAKLVQDAYHSLLGRYAEPAGLKQWVDFLAAGGTPEQLRADIAASPEYAQMHGGGDAGFVEGLYQNALGRFGTQEEVTAYTQALAGGTDRAAVAAGIFDSLESRLGRAQQFYQEFLHRDADPEGLWGSALALGQGTGELAVMDHILTSPEYAPAV